MDSSNDNHPVFHGTTILSVRRQTPQGLQVAIGGDGQVTLGNIIVKGTARKVRKLYHGKVLAGFAGATADAFTLFERFEAKLEKHQGNLVRSAVELAKDWRSDRALRRLEAMLAVADLELIQEIFKSFYQQRVVGGNRLRFLRRHDIRGVAADVQGVHLTLWDQNAMRESTVRYDAVVLATGYAREHHKTLLSPLDPYLGDYSVDRHYRLQGTPDFRPAIYLQGACEDSHGLSDTLLSVTSVRTGEIGSALLATPAGSAIHVHQEREAIGT